MTLHIHLDPLGGIAGDMFASAMGHAFPELRQAAIKMIEDSAYPVDILFKPYTDHVFTGLHFDVQGRPIGKGSYPELDRLIKRAMTDKAIIDQASKILDLLADAEARVHGVKREEVHFHEIGGWDTVVDILLAAFFIVKSGASSWSVSPIPMGGGYIESAHGRIPLPAPAAIELLKGFILYSDGQEGERVTPTGAAILKSLPLIPLTPLSQLMTCGHGFGARKLKGISNILRVNILEALDTGTSIETIGVLTFEIDDQTPEDLAVGLERIRSHSGVFDVSTSVMYAKKGRMATHVQVLSSHSAIQDIVNACLSETTTLGVRVEEIKRHSLQRTSASKPVDGQEVRIKTSLTPLGQSRIKAEMDDCADAGNYEARKVLRHKAEVG